MTQPQDSESFRFYNNREKYLLFTTTCSEKYESARRIGLEFEQLNPQPPALRVFQAGSGEGSLLSLVLRQLHSRWPNVPFLVVVKDYNAEMIRLALRNLADRFQEHPELVLVFTNMRYSEAPRCVPTDRQKEQRWRTVALDGQSAHSFDVQINDEMAFVDEAWEVTGATETGSPVYANPSALVLYRADQSFVLDNIIPRCDEGIEPYDLVIASHPYRSRLPAEVKVRTVLEPLASSLAPGGRMITIQSRGRDPGMEIIRHVWPNEAPFATPRQELIDALGSAMGKRWSEFTCAEPENNVAEFRYQLQLNPNDVESSIGTSTLLAAWNAAGYVAQIDDHRLTDAMSQQAYLPATSEILHKYDGLWFVNECFVVARARLQ